MADTSSSVAKIPPTEDPIVVFSEIENVNLFFTNLERKIKYDINMMMTKPAHRRRPDNTKRNTLPY